MAKRPNAAADASAGLRRETAAAAPLALTLCWRAGRIVALELRRSERDALSEGAGPEARAVQAGLRRLAAGRPAGFPALPLDWGIVPPFTRMVLRTLLKRVGPGEVVTYGELARLAGKPGAARAVGQAMARNPWPLVVPCHRVLGASGALTGYSNPEGLVLKAFLLRLEGVRR